MRSKAGFAFALILAAPATLTRLDGLQVTGGIMGILGNTQFDPDSGTTIAGGDGGNAAENAVAPGGMFGVYQLSEEWAVGANFTAPFVGSLDYRDTWAGRYFIQQFDLTSYRVAPSVAYQVNDWLSLGATAGVVYSEVELKVAVPTLGGDGSIKLKDADDWEVSWGLSAMMDLREGTRLGLVYNSEIDQDDLSGRLKVSLPVIPVGFSTGLDLGLTFPQSVFASLRQEVGDDLVVFMDVGWADFSEFSTIELNISGGPAVDLNAHFRDTIAYGIAAEYRLSPLWTLSAGILYASSPVSNSNRSVALPLDRQVRYGLGVRHQVREDVTLALSYEYLDLGDNQLSKTLTGGLAAGGTVSGDYSPSHVQFIAFTISKSF
jgi:long-chain fatty acid transport protein